MSGRNPEEIDARVAAIDVRIAAIVAGEKAMGEARSFSEHHRFQSYRLNRADGVKTPARDMHLSVNTWVARGASVEFNDDAGTVTITPSEEDNRPPFTYLGRKSK
ncbi:hypothetical protein [Streptomyces misionensis]|uniref:hypothetical protein n=1 Tax=Streptomyces misionensis TaxID=67331 RepID=UPI0036A73565